MGNIVDSIVSGLNNRFKGKLDCEEQRADLFVYINGNEEKIKAIDTTMIYFENEEHNVKLYDTDIHHLAYINEIINA
jgi:hypothetical protein